MRGRAAGTRSVGLLVESLTDRFWHEVVAAMASSARRRGVRLFVFVGGTLDAPEVSARQANRCYSLAAPAALDGLVIAPLGSSAGPERLAEYVKRYEPLPLSALSAVIDGVPSVCTDNVQSVRDTVVHLVREHHVERVAFLAGPRVNAEAELRLSGYREALQEVGLGYEPSLLLRGDFSEQSGERAIRELQLDATGLPFDGLVAANDSMAIGALSALRASGVRVPEDVRMVSIDDVPEGRWGKPSLSTVRQSLGRLTDCALDNVLRQLDGKPVERLRLVPGELLTRESCGCRAVIDQVPCEPRSTLHSEDDAELTAARLARALAPVSPGGAEELPEDWRSSLARALASDLSGATEEEFSSTLGNLLATAAVFGRELGDWQRVVSALRDALSSPALSRVESSLYRARLQISDVAERQQAALRTSSASMLARTIAAGSDVLGSFSERRLFDALTPHLPSLLLRCCFVTLYEPEPRWPPELSRLVFAHRDGERAALPVAGTPFETLELLPERCLGELPRTFIVAPLHFGDVALGTVIFELGPPQGQVYEWLREQMSVALEGARLLRRIEADASERDRADREFLERELRLAARLQTSVLPQQLRLRGLELAATMVPATEVGGDCYDVIPSPFGGWLSIGDVAGHGLGPGVVMMMLQSSVAAVLRANPDQSPAQALRQVNAVMFQSVRERLMQDEHATLMLVRYETDGHVAFAGAHEEPIVYRARTGQCEWLEAPGLWVGIKPDVGDMPETSLRLEPGDLLLLYTDGAVEAMGSDGSRFGVARLAAELASVHDRPAEEIVRHLLGAVKGFTRRQRDDVTLLLARQTGEATAGLEAAEE